MPAAPATTVRKPSAPYASRLLSDYPDLGITRALNARSIGYVVKGVAKEQEQHGGPVTVRWNQPDRDPAEARLIAHGRQTLMRQLLEDSGLAVAVHHGGYLVLLDPEDVDAHREAEQAAGMLLGDGAEFWREESGALLGDDVPVTTVPRATAVAEVALALRTGRAPYEQLSTVFMDGDITVTLTPVPDDEREERPESPLGEARRIFRQSGETVLDDQDAQKGTGVWVRASLVPGEVLVLRKDDGMRASGFGPAARRWERCMEFYRRLLEDAGWAMTGRGDLGWSFRRPTADDALTRAEKVLGALWPHHRLGERSGWVTGRHEGEHWQVRWRSENEDAERCEAAETAMLPYLADALRRVGLSTTMPDYLPRLPDEPPYAPGVYFAEPPADRSKPRFQTGWLREGWTMDTHTGCFRRHGETDEHAERLALFDNQDDETNRRLGRVSHGLPGLTSDLAEVPEFRMVAAELAAAGFLPAHRWEDRSRRQDGFLMCLDDKGIQVNHLSTQPDGMHRITRPVDEEQAHEFESYLLGYAEALDAPGRIVTLRADHLVVYAAEERRRRPQIPDGQLFDAAVTYRVDHGAPRTSMFVLSSWAVDPYGDGEPQRHRVAESVAAGRDVDRIVIDDVHPFAERGTRRHRAQMAAAEMLARVLGPDAVWCVEIDWLAATHPEVPRTPEEGVLLLSVPDNAPAGSVERIRGAAEELGWSSAVLSPSVAWVQVPAGGEAMV
ncbi:hypothetical protein [Streptomyces sp. 11x1]|uniref:hypothetical protein n=1 Tax=Streptomyces sp. 11x1 TaxID=3038642 RepID=UPI00292D6944|nr:hypothetical protein [Streptomyces sp. 11x1]WNZ14889.1 hypothetical protein P8T65_46485 [Streptomyces sp. 11x1]